MDKPKILSGDELVAKGITKNDATLPEVGMKDVTPNGSWLEQKQIQSALEARKNLIEVERIEKNGTLSHAEWRDDLNLAEVTQQSGGYWQYLGHSVEKKIYLYPEEALYLMEVNCLLLKHNEVTVSLQKAYSLLLQDKISIVEYKVYAHLSRLGYKVFRYNTNNDKQNAPIEDLSTKVGNSSKDEGVNSSDCITSYESNEETVNSNITIEANGENYETEKIKSDEAVHVLKTEDIKVDMAETDNQNKNSEESGIIEQESQVVTNENQSNSMEVDCPTTSNNTDIADKNTNAESPITKKRTNEIVDNTEQAIKRIKKDDNLLDTDSKLDRLKRRQTMPCDSKSLHNFFKIIPDLFQKDTVTITVPDEQFIPKNVFTNKLSYVLNLANMRAKTGGRKSTESQNYSMNDEVNTMNIRRIRSSSMNTPENMPTPPPRVNRLPRNNPQYRPFQFWKTRCNVQSFQYSFYYQRPFLANCFINQQRFHHPMMFRQVPNPNNVYFNQSAQHGQRTTRVRVGDGMQRYHLECLKNLASRLKNLVAAGNSQVQNIQSLRRLLQTYNRRYGTRLRLTEQFDMEDENIIETIELEDDDETFVKKQRTKLEEISKNHNLNKIKHLSMKLKKLEAMGKIVAPHRRALSNVVKHYNKHYNADIHLNEDYEIVDRRQVTLDSSSDSDCVIDEPPKAPKMYRNPFNVLRERLAGGESNSDNTTEAMATQYEELKKVFENWLPDANDFGRPDVVHNHHIRNRLMEYYRDQYIYDFLQEQQRKYKSWLEAKIAFLTQMDETAESYKNDHDTSMENETTDNSGISPIIKPEDCTDMPSMLKKLRIIETNKDDGCETSLVIVFDVYNRDVQNFRKSNPPTAHFRIICLNESSSLPDGKDIAALHMKYDDNVTIVFAIVGSSSISFLQINNFEIPVYVSSNDFP